jgi:hypothetical protein
VTALKSNPGDSILIGDSAVDIEAASAPNVEALLLSAFGSEGTANSK